MTVEIDITTFPINTEVPRTQAVYITDTVTKDNL